MITIVDHSTYHTDVVGMGAMGICTPKHTTPEASMLPVVEYLQLSAKFKNVVCMFGQGLVMRGVSLEGVCAGTLT